jgi:transposase
MQIIHTRCCGLDVHKRTVVACLRIIGEAGRLVRTTRTFGTTTGELEGLRRWLKEAGCSHVAMESTGVYWKPVYNILEGHFEEVLVANAGQVKAVPGRKTDVKDAEWLADLLAHGLIRGSNIPGADQRALRDLTRYRTTLTQDRARYVNRLHKVLEDTNIKLGAVVSDLMGVSARAILAAIVAGERDPGVLASHASTRLAADTATLEAALRGVVRPHHAFMLAEILTRIDQLDEAIARVSKEVEVQTRPFEAQIEHLDTIPGVNRRIAEVILAEVGTDMSRFPSAGHLASWAGMCPGNNESAGKRQSGRTRRGNHWLRVALVEAGHGAGRKKNCYLQAQYRRLAARRGKKRALVAVGHSILCIAYHVLADGEPYRELGGNYFDERDQARLQKSLIHRLERLGLKVTVAPLQDPPQEVLEPAA